LLLEKTRDAVAFIDAVFTLGYDSFQIVVANFFEEKVSVSFDVLGVDDSFRLVSLVKLLHKFLCLCQANPGCSMNKSFIDHPFLLHHFKSEYP
jgi:hypothetical protein